MNSAAASVLSTFHDAILAYGQSDEYSIVFRRETALFNRRKSKILSCVVSLFTSAYVRNWSRYIDDVPLQLAVRCAFATVCALVLYVLTNNRQPSFDARIVVYPTTAYLRDYLSWRQADVHVNNLFNTTFWALVGDGVSNAEAEQQLKGTLAADKNEILFSRFGINYNNEKQMFRKGTTIIRNPKPSNEPMKKENCEDTHFDGLLVTHEDIIGKEFWDKYPHLLDPPDSNPPRIRS